MFRLAKKLLPRFLKRGVRRRWEAVQRQRLFGALAPLVPAVEDMFDGPAGLEAFKGNGEEFLRIYRNVCDLRREERILDVGSGIGRKTIPLTGYLSAGASYDGIDVNELGVDWCRQKITPRFPNFRFQHIDVRNRLYNPQGTLSPGEYRFPFEDESFTFVVLGSVFTHMMPKDVEHYLAEVCRVLITGQRCLISYFLLNEESQSGRSTLDFAFKGDQYAAVSADKPEIAIALSEEFVGSLYQRLGMKVVRREYGSWCGRANALTYQDLILAVKT